MQKIKELIQELLCQYEEAEVKRKPKLSWRVQEALKEDEVHAHYAGGLLRIEVGSLFTFAFFLQQIITALKSGHFAESLGNFSPKFSFRALWLGTDRLWQLSEQLSVGVPDCDLEQLCKECLLLGYNTVVLGARENSRAGEIEEFDLNIFSSYGLKVFVKPTLASSSSLCPLDLAYRKFVGKALKGIPKGVGLMWESKLLEEEFFAHPKASESTLEELVVEELKMVESQMLIFYVPAKDQKTAAEHAKWLSAFSDEMANQTCLAFSAVAGPLTHDHLMPHPFFDELRKSPDVSATHLLPIINVGGVDQGECLWPSLSFDLIEQFFPRLKRHHFAGIIGLTHHVPSNHGLLHLSLWVAASALITGRSPRLLAETWCLANRSDIPFTSLVVAFEHVRALTKELSAIRSAEETPSQEDHQLFLARLNQLETRYAKNPCFRNYMTGFCIDAKNLLAKALHMSQTTRENGFWTRWDKDAEVKCLNRPLRGKPGSVMARVYEENQSTPIC